MLDTILNVRSSNIEKIVRTFSEIHSNVCANEMNRLREKKEKKNGIGIEAKRLKEMENIDGKCKMRIVSNKIKIGCK